MQVLKHIEDKFENLSLRIKIELFAFPLIIVCFVIYFIYDFEKEKSLESSTVELLSVENIKMSENIVDILKEIEKFAKKNSIHLENISNGSESIKIEAYSDIKNRILFLNYLENYNNFSKIKTVEISDDMLIVQISFDKFFEKKRIELNTILDDLDVKESIDFKVNAIVDNKVLINDKWFNIGEKIGSFNVFKIDKNSVILKNRYKKVVLKLYQNENI